MRRKFVIIAILSLLANLAVAQENRQMKRYENNITIGGGLFFETGSASYENNPGIVLLHLSYGLDVKIDERWSVMPGVGLRPMLGGIKHLGWAGGDADLIFMTDFFLICRYHFEYEGKRIIVGLGPAFSREIARDTYYIDANPWNPLDDKEKFRHFDVGLQPSIMFRHGRHFQWGLEGNIGFLNVMKQYPEYDVRGTKYLHYIGLTCGWHF